MVTSIWKTLSEAGIDDDNIRTGEFAYRARRELQNGAVCLLAKL